MVALDALDSLGCDTETGLSRCLNKKEFYLRMIDIGLRDDSFIVLGEELNKNNLDNAFKACHTVKGIVSNLSLTPLYEIVSELTELLRHKTEGDYKSLYNKIMKMRKVILKAASSV